MAHNKYHNGWLSPGGHFVPCGFDAHEIVAQWNGYKNISSMIAAGWVMIKDAKAEPPVADTAFQNHYLQFILKDLI